MKQFFKMLFELWIAPAFGKFILTPTITYVHAQGSVIRVGFNLTPSGTYTTAVGGDTINLATAAVDPSYVGMVPAIEALGAPIDFDIWDVSGNLANTYFPIMGNAQTNSKLKIASAFNTELGTGAYPGTIKLIGEAVFNKL
jgi:hypothetical protein